MARIRYIDEMNEGGELDLVHLKEGDLVKFKADFIKHGDGEGDGDDERKVCEGEVGEVLEVYPDMPGLLVEAPCEHKSMGSMVVGEAKVVVDPDAVALIVDARDPRLSSNRMLGLQGSLEPDELDSHVRGLGMTDLLVSYRQIVIASLTRANLRKAARLVARQSDDGWATYAMGAGLLKTAATPRDWLPLIMWSLEAMKGEYPGEKTLTLKNPRHVAWALRAMAQDLQGLLPNHELDYEDEDEENAHLASEMERLAETVSETSAANWSEQLPGLAEIMGDPALKQQFAVMMGDAPKPEVTPEDLQSILGPELTTAPTTAPAAPPAALDLPDLEQRVERETDRSRRWDEYLHGRDAPGAPLDVPGMGSEAPPPSVEEMLEEAPETEPAPQAPAPKAPASEAPRLELPSSTPGTTKYDVPAFDVSPSSEHGWAEPNQDIRIPIGVTPGYRGQGYTKSRSVRVWAEPEMPVINNKTKETGDIVGFEAPETVLVNVLSGSTGLPAGDEPQSWSAVETQLAEDWPAEELGPEELRSWRSDRNIRLQIERRDQSKSGDAPGWIHTADSVVITAHDLHQAHTQDQRTRHGSVGATSEVTSRRGASDPKGRGDTRDAPRQQRQLPHGQVRSGQRADRGVANARRASQPDSGSGDGPTDLTTVSVRDVYREFTT